MKMLRWSVASLVCFLCFASCSVWSQHPALPAGGAVADVQALVGDWEVLEVATQDVPNGVVLRLVATGDGEVAVSVPGNAAVVPRRGVVATIGRDMVLSIEREDQVWDVFRPVFRDDGTAEVFTWDLAVLRAAVADGVIAGVGLDFSSDDNEVEVREPSSALAQKLLEHPDLLGLRIATVRRVP